MFRRCLGRLLPTTPCRILGMGNGFAPWGRWVTTTGPLFFCAPRSGVPLRLRRSPFRPVRRMARRRAALRHAAAPRRRPVGTVEHAFRPRGATAERPLREPAERARLGAPASLAAKDLIGPGGAWAGALALAQTAPEERRAGLRDAFDKTRPASRPRRPKRSWLPGSGKGPGRRESRRRAGRGGGRRRFRTPGPARPRPTAGSPRPEAGGDAGAARKGPRVEPPRGRRAPEAASPQPSGR